MFGNDAEAAGEAVSFSRLHRNIPASKDSSSILLCGLLSCSDNANHESIVSLAAHRLYCSCLYSRLGGQQIDELANALDTVIRTARLNNLTFTHHIVGYNHRPRTGQLQRPLQVMRIVRLIRIRLSNNIAICTRSNESLPAALQQFIEICRSFPPGL